MKNNRDSDPIIFTLSFGKNDEMWNAVHNDTNSTAIPIKEVTMTTLAAAVNDQERIISEVTAESVKQQKPAIFNVTFRSNEQMPIVGLIHLKQCKDLGIKTCFTFSSYKDITSELQDSWKTLFEGVDHVFFTNTQDQALAIKRKDIEEEKTSNLQTLPNSYAIASKVLNTPKLKNLEASMKAASDKNDKITVTNKDKDSDEAIARIIADKFNVKDSDAIFGIRLEVEELLKLPDSSKKLADYVSQLSKQFEAEGKSFNNIHIDFNLEKPVVSKEYTQAVLEVGRGDKELDTAAASGDIPKEQRSLVTQWFDYFKSYFVSPFDYFKSYFISPKKDTTELSKDSGVRESSIPDWEKVGMKEEAYNAMFHEEPISKQNTSISVPFTQEIDISLTQSNIESMNNQKFNYEDVQIYSILKASLDSNKVSIQYPISLKIGLDGTKATLADAVLQVKQGKDATIIPIETGGEHWVGLAVTYDKKDQNVIFTYTDPMGNPLEGPRENLKNLIKQVEPNATIIDLQTQQQENDYDCGAFLTDNLIKLAQGQEILSTEQSKGAANGLRNNHKQLLDKVFAQQQTKNQDRIYPTPTPRNKERIRSSGGMYP